MFTTFNELPSDPNKQESERVTPEVTNRNKLSKVAVKTSNSHAHKTNVTIGFGLLIDLLSCAADQNPIKA